MKIRDKALLGCLVILGGVWIATESRHAIGGTLVFLAIIWLFAEISPGGTP